MHFIKKYVECWALHNDDTGESKPLTVHEKTTALERYPVLNDKKTITVFFDDKLFLGTNTAIQSRANRTRTAIQKEIKIE